ncbi:biotin--[acetyl-CoA-carboxylase] ligase [Blattabacterium cuenoti]|uniref:biotin--[acetyl-CoA-carboxylase] ligase n=1 Tax=Blattabacterium cuenoti TaxID=1653831 RepID=UPI00163BCFAC|nr:biotin--[acetyl-CoA-carboxylase] ligase [Blattabacterium cuenoti]
MKRFIWPIYLIFLKKVDSTNQYIKRNISKWMNNWTVIWSMHQTNGRGVGKNLWKTEKGKNLTFSIFFKSITLSIDKGYIMNMIISNAIHKTLFSYSKFIWIKWPNDIILMNKKIGGILIENKVFHKKIHTTIAGIGLNVNQLKFDYKFQATSLKKILNKDFELDKLFYNIIYSIQKEYFLFTIQGESNIRDYYVSHLYMKDKISFFYIKKNVHCEINGLYKGIIRNITKRGNLVIEFNKKKKFFFFSQKEVQLIF